MRKTPMSRLISWILVIVCIFSLIVLPTCAEEKNTTDVITEAKQGVVQIYAIGYDRYNNRQQSWTGTCFCVGNTEEGNGIFVTNWHVVTGEGNYDTDHVRLWILKENCRTRESDWQPDPSKSIECTTLYTTSGNPDIAIIETDVPVTEYTALPLLYSKEIAVGEPVYALGYPGAVGSNAITNSGINDITVTNGIVSQHLQAIYSDETWVLLHTALISSGNSGGPLITAQGAVIGVNAYGGENRYYAAYIDYVIDALDDLSLPYQTYGEASETGETTGPGETDVPEETGTQETVPDDDDHEKKSDGKQLIAAGTFLIVVVAVVFAAIKFKPFKLNTKPNSETHPDSYPGPTQPADPAFKLKVPDGRIIPVYDKVIIIGRDPSCDIRVPGEYTNIGRKHCSLQVLQGRLILTDMGSLNGIFIHGKRVPANARVALKNGNSFALGQSDYIITVI